MSNQLKPSINNQNQMCKLLESDIEAAQAKRKVAEAELAQAETMLDYTELIAPFDGR